MQQEITVSQRMVSGARRLQTAVRRGGGVGVLAGLLLLPLGVGAVGSGDLDPSFGGDGTVLTDFGSDIGVFAWATALAIQSDGKIVVAGTSGGGSSGIGEFVVARYRPTGTLDASFGGDGKIVVAGFSHASVFALARYHAITCNGVLATRVGTAGNDTLMGTAGPDVIVGFDGNDTIYGLGGHDLLCGNGGDDTLDGGSGSDLLEGDIGNDTLVGGTGDDTLHGDAGTDVCDGGAHISGDTASGCEQVTGVP